MQDDFKVFQLLRYCLDAGGYEREVEEYAVYPDAVPDRRGGVRQDLQPRGRGGDHIFTINHCCGSGSG